MWKVGYTLDNDADVIYVLPYEYSTKANAKEMVKVLQDNSTLSHYVIAPLQAK